MLKKAPDALDRKIIRLLTEDGRMPVGEIARRSGITAPTVRGRIKSMEESGLLKISGLIDPCRHQQLTTAIIGLNVETHGKIDRLLQDLADMEGVVWAAVVTGRYDILMKVAVSGGMDDLYKMTSNDLARLGTIVRSETFVVMKSINDWLRLPDNAEDPES
ncbi:MAG: Lrp/AsnC family transcriptional regulator [Syntrophobacteraceae bacterium]